MPLSVWFEGRCYAYCRKNTGNGVVAVVPAIMIHRPAGAVTVYNQLQGMPILVPYKAIVGFRGNDDIEPLFWLERIAACATDVGGRGLW